MNNGKTRIAVEDVLKLWDAVREINDLDFENIEWTIDGEELEIHRTVYREWIETGLGNMTFVVSGAYKWGSLLANMIKKSK